MTLLKLENIKEDLMSLKDRMRRDRDFENSLLESELKEEFFIRNNLVNRM